MILLRPEVAATLDGSLSGLQQALQYAVELEHATIPAYLYALYSLKPGQNQLVAEIIDSIVTEEMLHMALACNVLNAIGGSPVIDSPGFIPAYPGPLPGGVDTGVQACLRRCTPDLIYQTFMAIETPEDPMQFPVVPSAPLSAMADGGPTIGQFYHGIIDQIIQQGDGIFTGDPSLQLTASFSNIPLFPVVDVNTAQRALLTIVDQGEGTPDSPLDAEEAPAHYYRFAEIYYGRKLIPAPGLVPPYEYGGEVVPLDPNGVWPVVDDPIGSAYPAGSAADVANRQFNAVYTQVLKALHATFNGQPDHIATAVLKMLSLKQLAQNLVTIPFVDGWNAGPTFEYAA